MHWYTADSLDIRYSDWGLSHVQNWKATWDPSMQFPAQKKWRGFIAALGEASILANQSGWRDWRACQEAFPAEKKDAKNIQLHAHTKIYNFTQRTSQLHARNYANKRVSQTTNNSQRGKTLWGGGGKYLGVCESLAAHFQALLPQLRPNISSPPPAPLS